MEVKKRGRPSGKNFEFIKSIKLNQNQVNNWDSKEIKAFLDGKNLLNDLYALMNDKMDFIITPNSEDLELIKKIDLVIK